ncbi:MAG TPA: aldehyde dehydrogenase family protein, partial [Micrococcaceae bacterium]
HIFYTGNAAVGRLVMTAAAAHLTPVTLELGGKSPVYLDRTADLKAAAKRLAWGKFLNAGQTCVAPDYVLAPPGLADELAHHLRNAVRGLFGADPRTSPDYGRIINDRHFGRLAALLDGADVVFGGEADADSRYLAPTVLRSTADSAVMQEEIFGPILPLLEVAGEDEAISFINGRDKPLALYVFSGNKGTRERFTAETSSGALCFGIPAAHLLVHSLPFGGVGGSGTGAYHGKYSIDTFSHRKAVLDKPLRPDTMELVYPPYNRVKSKLLRTVIVPPGKP